MKILLIQPSSSESMVGFTQMIRPEPLALELIAASVPDHEVKILDMRVDPSFQETLASFQPDLVGVAGYTTDVPRMLETCAGVKSLSPDITTVVGGYHASLCPEDFDREFVDIIVVGEGEGTFKELVPSLQKRRNLAEVNGIIYRKDGRQVATPLRDLIANLDDVPLPARHLTDHYRQHYHFHFWENPYLVETARGCPFRCTYCAVWKFHRRRCRMKSPEAILEDLKTIPSRVICFADDNLFQNVRRAERLYEMIKSEGIEAQFWMQARADTIAKHPPLIEKWAEIGLDAVLVGLEKITEDDLAKINKKCSLASNEKAVRILEDKGVDVWGMFIVDPQWTTRDFDALIEYVKRMKISFPLFTVLTPLPGTALFQEKLSELMTRNYEVYDFLHTVLPTKLPLREFYENMARLYHNTTMGWNELKRRVKSGRIPVSSLRRVREVLRDVTNTDAYLRSVGPV